jgi:hypothetical protein
MIYCDKECGIGKNIDRHNGEFGMPLNALIFSMLIGDKVEPRRKFIEENAKYVRNLDV